MVRRLRSVLGSFSDTFTADEFDHLSDLQVSPCQGSRLSIEAEHLAATHSGRGCEQHRHVERASF